MCRILIIVYWKCGNDNKIIVEEENVIHSEDVDNEEKNN